MEICYVKDDTKYVFEGPSIYICLECHARTDLWINDSNKKVYNFCYKCENMLKDEYYYQSKYRHNINGYNFDYKSYRSQYTQHQNGKPLKYSSRIYLTKIIDKNYQNNNDIQINKDKILDFNDKFENSYKDIKDSTRKSSINAHFKLYKFLQLCGVKCNISDFNFKKSVKALSKYEIIWKEICRINNWNLTD